VADFLLDLARTATEDVCYNAMFAAAIADSARVSSTLLVIARDRSLRPANREQALKWVARAAPREGNDAVGAGVRVIAADETDHPDVRERAIRVLAHPGDDVFLRDLYGRLSLQALKERVIRVVAESQTPVNVEWLERIARDDREPIALRERAIRVLGEDLHETDRLRALYARLGHADLKDRVIRVVGEDGSEDAIHWIESIAVNRAEPHDARDRALRVLGEHGGVAYLRQIYGRLEDTELQDRVLREVGEAGGDDNIRFLRAVALDAQAAGDLRDRALRVLAESGMRTAELAGLYDTIADRELRERLIKLLGERGDRAARDKLAAIARNDPDQELRRRALKQLAESGDPRGRSS
jgi:predicted Zn-ribbon and HTH transcriptional regulator